MDRQDPGGGLLRVLLPGLLRHRQHDPGQLHLRQHERRVRRARLGHRPCHSGDERPGYCGRPEAHRHRHGKDRALHGADLHGGLHCHSGDEHPHGPCGIRGDFQGRFRGESRRRRHCGLRHETGHRAGHEAGRVLQRSRPWLLRHGPLQFQRPRACPAGHVGHL